MNRRDLWALVAVCAAGCAEGAPLEGESNETMATTTTSTTSTTTTTSTTSTTSTTTEATTGTSETTEATSETTTGTTGEPEVAGELYPFDQVHSPITAEVAAAMTTIAGKGTRTDAVFAKVGGTTTASGNFMRCLVDPVMIVGLPPQLQPTVDYFKSVPDGMGLTPYNRDSLAAMANWTAADVLAGMPSPLQQETDLITPRFAVVLLGTHELEQPQPDALYTFADNLVVAVDALIAGGTVPILTTLPARTQPPGVEVEVPRFNAVIRAVAQGRKIPLIDIGVALTGAPGQGLAGDGIDLSVAVDMMTNAAAPCSFDLANLDYGYNTRNLVTLEALDRAKQVVVDKMAAPDASAPELLGRGTLTEPLQIPGLPFVDMRSTAASASDVIDMYESIGCGAVDLSGPELVYELTVTEPTSIRAMVFDQGTVDVDLHLLTQLDAKTCVKRDDRLLTGPLQMPDTYYIVVDTVGAATPGEFMLVVLPEG